MWFLTSSTLVRRLFNVSVLPGKVPLKTINVSRYVRAAINFIIIIGYIIPEDLRLEVIVVDRTQEPGLLASLGDNGCGTDDVSAAKAQTAVADVKEDQDATLECVTVSFNCPLKRAKLVAPCRGAACRNQCFDTLAYLRLNEATFWPLWRCPVCDKDLDVKELRMDPFMLYVLRRVPEKCDAVQVFGDRRWTPLLDRRAGVICIQDSPMNQLRPMSQLRPANGKLGTSIID
ncbi:hypothetical protein HPB47_020380 [Ixodes persulcatus]|uniref:Uncharacterized protein n=1 Tax=Ixodes persulcatus TaxID=34615 RepID=A0AC60QGI3_IXOPE|nr:hypothetical protein HPB47_020380 [Ixodes persulcatus]